jgi:hypothetical protein
LAFSTLPFAKRQRHRNISGHGANGSQQGVLIKGDIMGESDGAQRGFDPSENRQ